MTLDIQKLKERIAEVRFFVSMSKSEAEALIAAVEEEKAGADGALKLLADALSRAQAAEAALEEAREDLRLMRSEIEGTAAPDLLEALKEIRRWIDHPKHFEAYINSICEEAITKAEGHAALSQARSAVHTKANSNG